MKFKVKLLMFIDKFEFIVERLSENLRVSQVPVVHVQVFTCYRVLLVRMRPSSFVSMWPSMVTELVIFILLFLY